MEFKGRNVLQVWFDCLLHGNFDPSLLRLVTWDSLLSCCRPTDRISFRRRMSGVPLWNRVLPSFPETAGSFQTCRLRHGKGPTGGLRVRSWKLERAATQRSLRQHRPGEGRQMAHCTGKSVITAEFGIHFPVGSSLNCSSLRSTLGVIGCHRTTSCTIRSDAQTGLTDWGGPSEEIHPPHPRPAASVPETRAEHKEFPERPRPNHGGRTQEPDRAWNGRSSANDMRGSMYALDGGDEDT
jgi:hypothetical protein